ncbi:hypothetical protein [Zobellia galactanivorans]|uniref:Uncharacterized protein n=1 Tax=Zobellia galactanivorans (strain DSM 12802 / CCUG 47099 / CIP 106680 / NCIMB 13871 / Dsij) TaxID=63186 RepID=G0L963_ZOBGA|nr:hypothetical protein [Zobellia galactanivorans]CAZ94356.1 Hypothetical protein ZOBELLIA_283 [Zobellia galactanivorans]
MFSDTEIAKEMGRQLVKRGVMDKQTLSSLINDGTTENDVRDKGNTIDQGKFKDYWKEMEKWVNNNGGDFNKLSGNLAQGREGGNPRGLTAKPLYNDAFKDVNIHINSSGFKPIKAISNQLRFIEIYQGLQQSQSPSRASSQSPSRASSQSPSRASSQSPKGIKSVPSRPKFRR